MSKQSIFHFTKERETLFAILTDGGFRTAGCLEEIELMSTRLKFALDMVSFSDIGPSSLESNLNSYGDYIIGLSKNWAKFKRLNPVNYIQSGSTSAELIEPLLLEILKSEDSLDLRYTYEQKDKKVIIKDIYTGERKLKIDLLKGILPFMKNYDGYLDRNENSIQEHRKHYDDREWRYVPTYEDWNSHHISSESFMNPDEHLERRSKQAKKEISIVVMLKFEANDIDHIIVSRDNDIKPIIDHINTCTHLYNTPEELDQIVKKICTKAQFLIS